MKKISILKRKLIKAYNNSNLKAHSIRKGYPKDTFYGYSSLDDYKNSIIKDYINFYGPSLRMWKYS